MKNIPLAQRLIVALDLSPVNGRRAINVRHDTYELADKLAGLGVIIKVNSVLRYTGYDMIRGLRNLGLGVFADLKLNDIGNTLTNDGLMLAEHPPDLLSVMCSTGIENMCALKKSVGSQTEVLGVTVLSSFNAAECISVYGKDIQRITATMGRMVNEAGLDGLILSAHRLPLIKDLVLTKNCPGIRPKWISVKDDNQKGIISPSISPSSAIMMGADRVIIGRPITQHPDPREAVESILEEIEEALTQRV